MLKRCSAETLHRSSGVGTSITAGSAAALSSGCKRQLLRASAGVRWRDRGARHLLGVIVPNRRCHDALVNVLLLYLVAKQIFGGVTLAAVSAAFLLFTPAHLTLGRSFRPDGVWHVPFVCAWLLSMAVIVRHRERSGRFLVLATGSIAASIYSQPSAGLMAVVLIALTIVALSHGPLTWRDLGAGIAVGAAVALPLLVWLLRDPSAYADTFGQWVVHQAHLRSPRAWWMAASHQTC